jgi:hypothetical protein
LPCCRHASSYWWISSSPGTRLSRHRSTRTARAAALSASHSGASAAASQWSSRAQATWNRSSRMERSSSTFLHRATWSAGILRSSDAPWSSSGRPPAASRPPERASPGPRPPHPGGPPYQHGPRTPAKPRTARSSRRGCRPGGGASKPLDPRVVRDGAVEHETYLGHDRRAVAGDLQSPLGYGAWPGGAPSAALPEPRWAGAAGSRPGTGRSTPEPRPTWRRVATARRSCRATAALRTSAAPRSGRREDPAPR